MMAELQDSGEPEIDGRKGNEMKRNRKNDEILL
jgi:hypothetical protein